MKRHIIKLADGQVEFLHDDDLIGLRRAIGGDVEMRRCSHVEPHGSSWIVDLAPVGGPKIGPFLTRAQALEAEVGWLVAHNLPDPKG